MSDLINALVTPRVGVSEALFVALVAVLVTQLLFAPFKGVPERVTMAAALVVSVIYVACCDGRDWWRL